MEDIFEAFIGAIYIDFQYENDAVKMPKHIPILPLTGAGYYVVEQWVITVMEKYIDFAELIQLKTNFKDMLVRYMQYTFQDAPRFFEISVEINKNKKIFRYCVKDKAGAVLGTAKGQSKKDAENNSAKEALLYYGQNIE